MSVFKKNYGRFYHHVVVVVVGVAPVPRLYLVVPAGPDLCFDRVSCVHTALNTTMYSMHAAIIIL
jgi:hypothetical protein